jgi:hypothetical protein
MRFEAVHARSTECRLDFSEDSTLFNFERKLSALVAVFKAGMVGGQEAQDSGEGRAAIQQNEWAAVIQMARSTFASIRPDLRNKTNGTYQS